jgi:hypothetical protein
MKRLSLALIACMICPAANATETAGFLNILPGARPMAMGEAYTAVADDLNAMTTNPAGLGLVGARQAAFMHAELFAGSKYDFAGYAHPLGATTMGFGFQRLAQGGLEGRDAAGRPTGSFETSDTALNLAVSRHLPGSRMMGGLNVKYIESRLESASARTVAIDAGLQRPISANGLPMTLGAAVRNLGPGLKLGQEREDLPLLVSVGAGVRLAGALLLSADVSHRPHGAGGATVGFGSEYAVMPTFSVRAGYAANQVNQVSPIGGLGFGFGVRVFRTSIDYSFSPAGELGNTQRISLSSKF